jgi:antitoxin (DNA-binding transcriptional repressor) of toxin-antitoxin stability system
MDIMSVGEFKSNFSEILKEISAGKKIGVTYGKKKKMVGIFVPVEKNKNKFVRKLGIWEGKATVKFAKDWKMTDEEFLNS